MKRVIVLWFCTIILFTSLYVNKTSVSEFFSGQSFTGTIKLKHTGATGAHLSIQNLSIKLGKRQFLYIQFLALIKKVRTQVWIDSTTPDIHQDVSRWHIDKLKISEIEFYLFSRNTTPQFHWEPSWTHLEFHVQGLS